MLYLESHIEVMGQADLLQWFMNAKKTGACSFSQGRKNRRLFVREGQIVACESNEPHLLLGQFLISSGRIAPDVLRRSMLLQERTGSLLGKILIEAGAIAEDELRRLVVAKAEETVLGLAEWKHGVFRFVPDLEPCPGAMQVDLPIQHVLLEGARRVDEMVRALETLKSCHAVLHKTDRSIDAPTVASFMGRRLYELIDGQRTTAELILQCRASRYSAYKFLSRLIERGQVRVGEVREAQVESTQRDRTNLTLAELQQLVAHEHYEAALDLIDSHGITHGHDDILSMLIAKAEAGYIGAAYRTKLPPESVPHRSSDLIVRGDLSADEVFLLELVDGNWDIRSLVWISPLRKVEVIRGLARLLNLGYIDLIARAGGVSSVTAADEADERTVEKTVDEVLHKRQPA